MEISPLKLLGESKMKNVIIIILFIVSDMNSQIIKQWDISTSGINYFFVRDVRTDYNDNIYFCGGNRDFNVLKFNMNGIQLWYDKYNAGGLGNNVNWANKLAIDPDGSIYVTGSISQNKLNSLTDLIIIKYSTSGNILWSKTYSGPGLLDDSGRDIVIDQEGFIYVAGYSSGSVTNRDMLLIKYDSNGNQIWLRTYGGNLEDLFSSIKVDSNNNVIVVGTSFVNNNNEDSYVIKYDKNGNVLWYRNYDDINHLGNYGELLLLGSNNDIYVGGYEKNSSGYISNYFILKYDTNGNQLWSYKCPESLRNSRIVDMYEYSGKLFLLGYYSLFNTNSINIDWLISCLNLNDGTVEWIRSVDGKANGWDTPSKISRINNVILFVGNIENVGTGYDIFFVGLDISSNMIFSDTYNSPEYLNDNATAAFTNDNSIYIGGYKSNGTTSTGLLLKYNYSTMFLQKPNLVSPLNNSSGLSLSVELVWLPIQNATSYNLQVSTKSDFSSIVYTYSNIIMPSRRISSLNYNTKYYWRVNATNGNNTSDWSEVWSFTTQPSASNYWQTTNWNLQNTGIQAITSNKQNHIFVCTATDGIYRSTDLGNNWQKLINGLTPSNITSISIDELDRIFIGTHGSGVYYSTNNGDSWNKTNLSANYINKIFALNNYIFAGDGYSCTGVYRSTDMGFSWTNVKSGLGSCTGNVMIMTNGLVFGGSGIEGMYKSTNYGNSWTQINNGLTSTNISTMTYDNFNNIYVGTQTNIYSGMPGRGVFKSSDFGATWVNLTNGITTSEISQLATVGNGIIFTSGAGNNAIFRSTNFGNTWSQFSNGLPNNSAVGPICITKSGYIFTSVNNIIYKIFDPLTGLNYNPYTIPFELILYQNYPNPFNPTTTISFSVPNSQFVMLKVYDILGREISTLVNEEKQPGNYEVKFDGNNLASGIYYYQIRAGQFVDTKKLVLLK